MRQLLSLAAAVAGLAFAGSALADAASEAQLKDQLAQAQAELARYKDGFERANAALAQVGAAQQKAAADQAYAGKVLDYCQAKNVYLIGLGEQILVEASRKRPIPDPFTQLMRVKLENQQQEYEDKIRAGRFDPRLDRPVADARPSGPAQPVETPSAAAPAKPSDPPPAKPDGGA